MTSPVETIHRDCLCDEALKMMLDKHIRHLPIVDREGGIHGMLSLRNLLEHVVGYLQRELHSLDQYMANDGPGG